MTATVTVSPTPSLAPRRWARARRHANEALNLILVALALPAAFFLRFETWPAPLYQAMLWHAAPWALLVKFCVFRAFALRDLAWRYLGFDDLLGIVTANLAASAVIALLLRPLVGSAFPRSIYILDWLLSIVFLALVRAVARLWLDWRRNGARGLARTGFAGVRRILIYGAGQAGRRVLSEIRAHPEMGVEAVGFADDDPGKTHLRMCGLRVWGGRADLDSTVRRLGVDQVWLATPAATGTEIAAILEHCHRARVPAKRIPPLTELIENQVLVGQLRDVRIEDLLGRPPVRFAAAPASLRGQRVLVTGAGGSIGSELCRQIARARPAALIGLDHSESALYQIDQELRGHYPALEFFPEIASVQKGRRVEEIFRRHAPQVVYHAAAYKHVPLMESQVFEAIENNVFGTEQVARAAVQAGVEAFVLISSDKAVRPANIMGATKRLAELVCLSRNRAQEPLAPLLVAPRGASGGQDWPPETATTTARAGTRFMAVRFGNVLGSSGSVIPLFRRQIAAGGPVTVTHPDVQRYFMTIPEAVELVLHTAELGSGGEIFVLDMGEPVKIVDLARKMVLLSGLRPDEDIRIEFCGMRPGEKLFEELHLAEEDTLLTPHPKIRVYRSAARLPGTQNRPPERAADGSSAGWNLKTLEHGVATRDFAATLLALKEMVPDYSPSSLVLRRAFGESGVRGQAAGA